MKEAHDGVAGSVKTDKVIVPDLSPEHLTMLTNESCINPEIIESRGYRTVTVKAGLQRLGFSASQLHTPGLLIPIYGTNGEISLYQLRPDSPRIDKQSKRPIKYETVAGATMRLDVHPSVRERLADPSIPLWITEGVKKGDALVSKGVTAVALVGVWNWRGTNEKGGKTALPEWEDIALNGRDVTIVFDSDVMIKDGVYKALQRLSALLKQRGAHVHYVYLPDAPDGKKIGVDDYFHLGHGVDDLKALQTSQLKTPPVNEDETTTLTAGSYSEVDGRLCWRKESYQDGAVVTTHIPLCNFTARIIEQVTVDDGVEMKRHLKIKGTLETGEPLPEIEVPASGFAAFGWLQEAWGSKAIINAGQANKDRLREAIQRFSLKDGMTDTVTYGHLGWRYLDGQWCYLHAGGAITQEGNRDDIAVSAEGDLEAYHLQPCRDPLTALKASISFLQLAVISIILWLAIYRSVIDKADSSLYLSGYTGSRKTTLAYAALAHYGITDRYNAPTWEATANALEGMTFIAKDALLLIDDFAPQSDRRNTDEYQRKAARVLRAQGNGQARARMNSDGTLRAVKPPRGTLIITGEDIAKGNSIRARCLILELSRDSVNLAKLTCYQKLANAGVVSQAMTLFLQWLAPRLDDVRDQLKEARAHYRPHFESHHGRTTDAACELMFTADLLETFLAEYGIRVPELRERAFSSLLSLIGAQTEHQKDQDDSERFLTYLWAALSSGRAHLTAKNGREPKQNALEYGWKLVDTQYGSVFQAQGNRIGWVDDDSLILLDPTAAYSAVQKMANESGDHIGVTPRTLWKRMSEAGLIQSNRGDANVYKATIDGERTNVIRLSTPIPSDNRDFRDTDQKHREERKKRCPEKFYCPENNRDTSEPPSETDVTVPKINGTPDIIGTQETPSETAQVPTVPKVPKSGGYKAPKRGNSSKKAPRSGEWGEI